MKKLGVWCPGGAAQAVKLLCRHTVLEVAQLAFVEGDSPPDTEVVLAMGDKVVKMLREKGVIPGNLGVKALRGTPVQTSARQYVITVSAGATLFNESASSEILVDLRLAERLLETGSAHSEMGRYRYVDEFEDIIAEVERLYEESQEPVSLAMDTETMGFYPWYPLKKIVSLQLSLKAGTADVVYLLRDDWDPVAWELFLLHVEWLLNTPKVKLCGANLKFDLIWIRVKWGILCTNFKFDTTLVGSLLDENRSNALSIHAWTETTMGGYDAYLNKHYDKGHMELVPKDVLLHYAGGDPDATLRVAEKFREKLLADPWLTNLYIKIVHPAARAWENIEYRGICVDLNRYGVLEDKLEVEMARLEAIMNKLLTSRVKAKHANSLSYTKASLITDHLFSPFGLNLTPKVLTDKTKAPSTSYKQHLSMFANHPVAGPFVLALRDWVKAQKVMSTYVTGFLKHLRPDGRFHPTYMLFRGAVHDDPNDEGGGRTGRTSAKDPAIQTVPKRGVWAKLLRDCIIAPPGWLIWSTDWSQGELRLTACLSGDTRMLEVYRNNGDLHVVTAAKFSNMTPDQLMALAVSDHELYESIRFKGKAGNFGLIFGMSPEGFMHYVRMEYDLLISLIEAEVWHDGFFALYPGIAKYQDAMEEAARRDGYVMSPFGRKRRLPLINSPDGGIRGHARRQAGNAPIQACLTDMAQCAIGIIDREIDSEVLTVNLMVHDEIAGYVREDQTDRVRDVIDIMENLPFEKDFGWKPQLRFPVDAGIGTSMARLEDYTG